MNGVFPSEAIGRRGAHWPIRKHPISTAILNAFFSYIAPNVKFYAKRRSLIFVLVPSLALEVACEVLAPSLIPPPSQKLANLLTEVKLTKYWISTHCC
jgi:hypothetical protein